MMIGTTVDFMLVMQLLATVVEVDTMYNRSSQHAN